MDKKRKASSDPTGEATMPRNGAPDPTTDPSPPYELLITASKGSGLFATRAIKAGTRLIAELPLLIVPPGATSKDLATHFSTLTPAQHAAYTDLASREDLIPRGVKTHIRKTLAAKYSPPGLEAAVRDSFKMHAIYYTNNVQMDTNGRYGNGVFRDYSRINHSCRRNVYNSFNPTLGKETIHALRDIKAGEEILASYVALNVVLRDQRREALRENWGFECECEVCGEETGVGEGRRERLAEIEQGLAIFERKNVYLTTFSPYPVPKDDGEALGWLEESVGILKEEGLVGMNLIHAYRECSKYCIKLGKMAKAMAYARKELEMERICLGDETDHLEPNNEGAKFWIQHLGKMSEQEAVKDWMNQKREAKEQKKADKKAAKKAGKGGK